MKGGKRHDDIFGSGRRGGGNRRNDGCRGGVRRGRNNRFRDGRQHGGPRTKAPSVDTVTLQGKVRYALKVSPKPGNGATGGRIGSVVFVYNSKGQLHIKFMDSKNALIYQTPPQTMASTTDLMMSPNSSVAQAYKA